MADVDKVWWTTERVVAGKKVAIGAVRDSFPAAYEDMEQAFGVPAAAQLLGHLAELGTEDAMANLAAGGAVANYTPGTANFKGPANNSTPAGPRCDHGDRVWVTGTSAKGPWKAWMCSADKNDPTKCKPEWVK